MIITIDTEKKEITSNDHVSRFDIYEALVDSMLCELDDYSLITPGPLQPVTESSTISQPVPYFGDEVLFV